MQYKDLLIYLRLFSNFINKVRGIQKMRIKHPLGYISFTLVTLQFRVYPDIVSLSDAGWSSLAARRAHNPKVIGSNPIPATK